MGVLAIPKAPLVSASEAIELSKHVGGITAVNTVTKIVDEWEPCCQNAAYDYYCMLSAVYLAGYIQGKREERAKKKRDHRQ